MLPTGKYSMTAIVQEEIERGETCNLYGMKKPASDVSQRAAALATRIGELMAEFVTAKITVRLNQSGATPQTFRKLRSAVVFEDFDTVPQVASDAGSNLHRKLVTETEFRLFTVAPAESGVYEVPLDHTLLFSRYCAETKVWYKLHASPEHAATEVEPSTWIRKGYVKGWRPVQVTA